MNEVTNTTNNALSNVIDFSELGEELAGLSLNFERIKIPSGGGLAFEVPGDNPDSPDTVKSIRGVIVLQHPVNVFYKEKFDGSNNAPDCSSLDGINGTDSDGEMHLCAKCPNFVFGSGENGSKACKQKRRLFILREGEALPVILVVPTGSIKEFSAFATRLLSKGKRTSGVLTDFTLRKAKNSTGITYSQLLCSVVRDLTPEESASVAALSKQVKEYAMHTDVGIEDEEQTVASGLKPTNDDPPFLYK